MVRTLAVDTACSLDPLLRAALSNAVVGTVGRAVSEYASRSAQSAVKDLEELETVGEMLVGLFKPFGQPLAVADFGIRKCMFDAYCDAAMFEEAARTMNTAIALPKDQEARILTEIAQCFLNAEDSGKAEITLRRVTDLIGERELDKETMLRHKACRAQIADLRRNYQQAAALYSSLSQLEGDVVQSDLDMFLDKAAVCAILDRAGPQRQRLLTKIYRDPRAEVLPSFVMLEKMCRQRLVRSAEVEAFRGSLQAHHLANLGDGTTVLDRAVREHNIFAASVLYSSISFKSLGELLQVDAASAEKIAARMIEDGRLEAVIDQIEGFVDFGSGTSDELAGWDHSLKELFGSVATAVDSIQTAHPSLAPE
jgi:COP9 signalosome complex subunit 4